MSLPVKVRNKSLTYLNIFLEVLTSNKEKNFKTQGTVLNRIHANFYFSTQTKYSGVEA